MEIYFDPKTNEFHDSHWRPFTPEQLRAIRDVAKAYLRIPKAKYARHCSTMLYFFEHSSAYVKDIDLSKILCKCADCDCAYRRAVYYAEKHEAELLAKKKEPTHRYGKKLGYVYALHNNRNQYTKLGFSFRPDSREKTLQAEDPDSEMILLLRGTQGDEAAFHQQFAHKRIRGEWFDLTQEDLQTIGLRKNA